jgi:hypothetical protein
MARQNLRMNTPAERVVADATSRLAEAESMAASDPSLQLAAQA